MGLGNNETNKIYVNISKGKMVVKKGDKTEVYNYLEGMLTDIQIVDADYEGRKYKKLCLTLVDDTDVFLLQMKMDSGYAIAFCKIIPNANPNIAMKLTPTYSEEDGIKKSGMFINQNHVALKWFYTRDNMKDCPPLKETTFKGEKAWDNTEQQQFFMHMLINTIKPKLPHPIIAAGEPAAPVQQTSGSNGKVFDANINPEYVDDLPF